MKITEFNLPGDPDHQADTALVKRLIAQVSESLDGQHQDTAVTFLTSVVLTLTIAIEKSTGRRVNWQAISEHIGEQLKRARAISAAAAAQRRGAPS